MEQFEHEDVVRGNARRILGDEGLVEDVVQETYLAAWLDRDREKDNRRAWLARVARNFALMQLRAHRRRYDRENEVARPEALPSVGGEVENRELHLLVGDALGRLGEPYAASVRLRYIDGLSYHEIGERVNVGSEAARSRVREGVRRMRAELIRPRREHHGMFLWLLGLLRGPRVPIAAVGVALVACVVGLMALFSGSATPVAPRSPSAILPVEESAAPRTIANVARPSGLDADPNRIAGPDIRVTGTVMTGLLPVENARVVAQRAYEEPEYGRTGDAEPLAVATTDDGGRFVLRMARRSRFTVLAEHAGYGQENALVHTPLTGDPHDVVLNLPPSFPVRARVVDSNRAPIPGARVTARSNGNVKAAHRRTAISDSSGRVSIPMGLEDQYEPLSLRVNVAGYAEVSQQVRLPNVPKWVAWEHVFVMTRGGVLAGTIRDPEGMPIGECDVTVKCFDKRHLRQHSVTVRTGKDGRYRIDVLPPLPVSRIVVRPLHRPELVALDHRVTTTMFLLPGQTTTRDFALNAGRTVEGGLVRAADGGSVADARVTLFARRNWTIATMQDRLLSPVARTRSDKTGRFRFDGISSGEYAIEATAPGLGRFVNRRERPGIPIRIDFSVTHTDPPFQRLILDPTGVIAVDLAYPRSWFMSGRSRLRQTLARATLRVGQVVQECVVDPTGTVVFDKVPVGVPGTLLLGNRQAATGLLAVAGETRSFQARKPKYAVLELMVHDENGAPMGDASVGISGSPAWKDMRGIELKFPRLGVGDTAADGTRLLFLDEFDIAGIRDNWAIGAKRPHTRLTIMRGQGLPDLGGTRRIEITLERGERIQGQIDGCSRSEFCWVEWNRRGLPRRNWTVGVARVGRGSFVMDGLEPGMYALRVRTHRAAGRVIAVTAGSSNVRLTVDPVKPRVVLAGAVVDRAGRSVAWAKVEAFRDGVAIARFDTQPNGSWRFLVPPGKYDLKVSPGSSGVVFSPMRIQGVDPRLDHTIEVDLAHDIAGHVTDVEHVSVVGATVLLKDVRDVDSPRPCLMTKTDVAGGFVFPGATSPYSELVVLKHGYVIARVAWRKNLTRFTVVIARDSPLVGRVRGHGTGPLPPVRIRLMPVGKTSRRRVELLHRGVEPHVGRLRDFLSLTDTTDEDGRFLLRNVPAGECLIVGRAPAGWGVVPHRVLVGDDAINVTMDVRASRKVRGQVLGMPSSMETAGWSVVATSHGIEIARANVGEEGDFYFGELPRGALQLELRSRSGGSAVAALDADSIHASLTWNDRGSD